MYPGLARSLSTEPSRSALGRPGMVRVVISFSLMKPPLKQVSRMTTFLQGRASSQASSSSSLMLVAGSSVASQGQMYSSYPSTSSRGLRSSP